MMVKLEGLTKGEIYNIDQKRISEENSRKYEGLKYKFLKIVESMFNIPSSPLYTWFFGTKGRQRVVNKSGLVGGSYDLVVYLYPVSQLNTRHVCFSATIEENPNYVHETSKNRIVVEHPGILEDALRLARAYEEAGFREFTIKKQYEEPLCRD